MKAGWRKRTLVRAGRFIASVSLCYLGLLALIWFNRTELKIESTALGERRSVTVFGGHDRSVGAHVAAIYALDGDKHRHALLPAAHAAMIAALHGRSMPLYVAIHDHGRRDVDFRPVRVRPAAWRPDIKGRGPAFDSFLLNELRSEMDRRFGVFKGQYLFGHSLGGLYALDMPTRRPRHGFSGLYAFSPTFSHDLSVMDRLSGLCANSQYIHAIIGLESGRDTAVFDQAERRFTRSEHCREKVYISRHSGIVHQIVMLTGQIEALLHIHSNP